MDLESVTALAAQFLEIAGVGVMVLGAVLSPILAVLRTRGPPRGQRYRAMRGYLGSAIMLGLEFLIAADIIRTVSESPTVENLLGLALIVLIRSFLSFTLEFELEGHWPWKQQRESHGSRTQTGPVSSAPIAGGGPGGR